MLWVYCFRGIPADPCAVNMRKVRAVQQRHPFRRDRPHQVVRLVVVVQCKVVDLLRGVQPYPRVSGRAGAYIAAAEQVLLHFDVGVVNRFAVRHAYRKLVAYTVQCIDGRRFRYNLIAQHRRRVAYQFGIIVLILVIAQHKAPPLVHEVLVDGLVIGIGRIQTPAELAQQIALGCRIVRRNNAAHGARIHKYRQRDIIVQQVLAGATGVLQTSQVRRRQDHGITVDQHQILVQRQRRAMRTIISCMRCIQLCQHLADVRITARNAPVRPLLRRRIWIRRGDQPGV